MDVYINCLFGTSFSCVLQKPIVRALTFPHDWFASDSPVASGNGHVVLSLFDRNAVGETGASFCEKYVRYLISVNV